MPVHETHNRLGSNHRNAYRISNREQDLQTHRAKSILEVPSGYGFVNQARMWNVQMHNNQTSQRQYGPLSSKPSVNYNFNAILKAYCSAFKRGSFAVGSFSVCLRRLVEFLFKQYFLCLHSIILTHVDCMPVSTWFQHEFRLLARSIDWSFLHSSKRRFWWMINIDLTLRPCLCLDSHLTETFSRNCTDRRSACADRKGDQHLAIVCRFEALSWRELIIPKMSFKPTTTRNPKWLPQTAFSTII